jgi:type IV secretion system protein VirB6
MAGCPLIGPDSPFLSGVLYYVDCQAQTIGESGYHALAAPGSSVALMLTGALTLFIALFGYRLILGETPSARDGVIAAVKIGVVLMLATSWPAFRTLAYDVALHGPAELAATIGAPSGLPGAGGGLVSRLQIVDDQLIELNTIGTGKPPGAEVIAGPTETLTPQQQQQEMQRLNRLAQRPRWDPARDAALLGNGRILFLTGAIAAFASVRIVAGLLLALAPLFALFLLFDATRGLFEGWVRGLAGAALGALATAILLGVELALVEPWLAATLAARNADIATPAVPVELVVLSLGFDLALLAALIATVRVAQGFRLPAPLRLAAHQIAERIGGGAARPAVEMRDPIAADRRPRAVAIADAVVATQRREGSHGPGYTGGAGGPMIGGGRTYAPAGSASGIAASAPLGQSFRRRTRARVSASAGRREKA